MSRFLPVAIVVLALLDGLIHLGVDLFIFPRFSLGNSLMLLLLLNFVGYLVLAAAFYALRRAPIPWRRALDGVFILYALTTIVMWATRGGPNPRGLGYTAKAVEVLLIVALLAHAATLGREAPAMTPVGVAKNDAR
jgi:hypothetical protein